MVDVSNILETELGVLVNDFVEKHKALGMRATGEWENSVEIQSDLTGARILANDYTEYLVNGRGPGKRPPISNLEKWVQAKMGLSGKEALGAAFAIATKISKEGTTWYQSGGSDLIDGVLTKQRQKEILSKVAKAVTIQIKEALIRSTKSLAA